MIPTLFGILLVCFVIVQFVPGGPVERIISQLTGQGGNAMDRISGGGADIRPRRRISLAPGLGNSKYRGAQGLDPAFIASLEKQFGLDKPPLERFGLLVWNYVRFDFGRELFPRYQRHRV